MKPLAYCEDKLAHPHSHYPLLRVFLTPEQRSRHAPLQALRAELLAIPDEVSDAQVAHAKLQWWSEELQRLHEGAPRHLVTRALAPQLGALDVGDLLGMVMAVHERLTGPARWPDFPALQRWCEGVSGVAASLEAALVQSGDADRETAARLGTASHLTRLLLGGGLEPGCVPLADAARFQMPPRPSARTASVQDFLEAQCERIDALFAAGTGLSPEKKLELMALTVGAELDRRQLLNFVRSGEIQAAGMSPVSRLWRTWRAASRIKRQALDA